jgi:hypothetical protein
MKIPFCPPALAKRYVSYLHSRYGIPLPLLKSYRWIQHKESVFVVGTHAQSLSESNANIFALGMLSFSNGTTFEPTSNFITLVGGLISQNVIPLNASQMDSFFQRKKIDREFLDTTHVLSEGWVAVSFGGKVIGSASLTRNHLIPNLPPTMHAEENE